MRKDRMKQPPRRGMYEGRRPVRTVTLDAATVLQMECWERAYGEVFGTQVTHNAMLTYWMDSIGRTDREKGKSRRRGATMDADVAKLARRYIRESIRERHDKVAEAAAGAAVAQVKALSEAEGISMADAARRIQNQVKEDHARRFKEDLMKCGWPMKPEERRGVLDCLEGVTPGIAVDDSRSPGDLVGVYIGGRGLSYLYRVYAGGVPGTVVIFKKKGKGVDVVTVDPSTVYPVSEGLRKYLEKPGL